MKESVEFTDDPQITIRNIPDFFDKDVYDKGKFNSVLEDVYRKDVLKSFTDDDKVTEKDIKVVADCGYGDVCVFIAKDVIDRLGLTEKDFGAIEGNSDDLQFDEKNFESAKHED